MVTYIVNDRLLWKGISWVWCQGPRVDRSNAWVDDNGDLNLRMQKFDGIYKGVLFETPTPYQYGRMRWTASSPTLNIERNACLGLNTYYDDPDTTIPNELDIEINQWPGYDERIWFSCHPASIDSHPVNIRHGFHKAPTSIQITPTSSLGSAASLWVSSKDTGTGNLFTVSVDDNPGVDVTFEWVAVL